MILLLCQNENEFLKKRWREGIVLTLLRGHELECSKGYFFIQGGSRISPVAIFGGKTTTRFSACH